MTQTAPAPPEKGACSVLVVSSGQKAAQFLAGLLPPGEFTPILSVTTVGEAKRQLVDREFDLLLINTPLSDDFGMDLAIDAAQNQGCGVLLFVKAELLDAVHSGIYAKAKANLDAHIYEAHSLEEAKAVQEKNGGFIKTMWCGDLECELAMKDRAGMSSRCIPFEQEHIDDVCPVCGKPAKCMIYWGVAY